MKDRPRFVRKSDGPTCGGLIGEFVASYADLRKIFGPPRRIDFTRSGGKVTTSWYVHDNKLNCTFEIYDYKETNRYDRNLPSIRRFRAQPEYMWHIGATHQNIDVSALIEFVKSMSVQTSA